MKKIAICNFNDLIGEEDAISVNTMLKIEKIKKEKYLLGVYTNRSIEEILYYNRDFPFIDYIINDKGFFIYDVKKSKKILNKKINKQFISKLCKMYQKNTITFIGENGIIKENRIKDEDIYVIEIQSKENKLDDFSLFIKQSKNKIIISKEEISYKKSIEELCALNKIDKDNIIHIKK